MNRPDTRSGTAAFDWHPHSSDTKETSSIVNKQIEYYMRDLGANGGEFNTNKAAEFVAVLAHDLKTCTNEQCKAARASMIEKGMLKINRRDNTEQIDANSEGIRYAAELLGGDMVVSAKMFAQQFGTKSERSLVEKDAFVADYRQQLQGALMRVVTMQYVPTKYVREHIPAGSSAPETGDKMKNYVLATMINLTRGQEGGQLENILRQVGAINREGALVLKNDTLKNLVYRVADYALKISGPEPVLKERVEGVLSSGIKALAPDSSGQDGVVSTGTR